MNELKLVKVLWLDTQDFDHATWASDDEIDEFGEEPCEIESVGWIVKKTKLYLTIAGDFSPSPNTSGRVMKIPIKSIKKITPLE